jgi:hypothetical protein
MNFTHLLPPFKAPYYKLKKIDLSSIFDTEREGDLFFQTHFKQFPLKIKGGFY